MALQRNALTDAGLARLRPLLAGRLSGLRELTFGSGLTAAGVGTLVGLAADGHLAELKVRPFPAHRASRTPMPARVRGSTHMRLSTPTPLHMGARR